MDMELVRWLDHRDSHPPEAMTHALASSEAVNWPQLSTQPQPTAWSSLTPTASRSDPMAPPPAVAKQFKPTYRETRQVGGLAACKRLRLPDSPEEVDAHDREDCGVSGCSGVTAQPSTEQVRLCVHSTENAASHARLSSGVWQSTVPLSTRHQVPAPGLGMHADVKASSHDPIGTGYASQECSKASSCGSSSCSLPGVAADQQAGSSSCSLTVAAAVRQGGSSSCSLTTAAAVQQGGSSSGGAAGCMPLNSPCSSESDKGVSVPSVCVDLSSMGSLGLIPDAAFLLRVVHTALKSINRCGVGHRSGHTTTSATVLTQGLGLQRRVEIPGIISGIHQSPWSTLEEFVMDLAPSCKMRHEAVPDTICQHLLLLLVSCPVAPITTLSSTVSGSVNVLDTSCVTLWHTTTIFQMGMVICCLPDLAEAVVRLGEQHGAELVSYRVGKSIQHA